MAHIQLCSGELVEVDPEILEILEAYRWYLPAEGASIKGSASTQKLGRGRLSFVFQGDA